MNTPTKLNINTLYIDNNAREVLHLVEKLANSDKDLVRATVPSLCVIAESGAGCTNYGKLYSEILEKSPVLHIRGTKTFLELVFPKDNPQDEKRFFSSPQRAASVRNRFYGTMLISLREYSGQDLMKSDGFKALLEFVEANKGNIHFIFHLLPQFNAKNRLMARLRQYINVVEVVLEKPALEQAEAYVANELMKVGYIIEENVVERLRKDILSELVERKDYAGFKSLNNLVERIHYEAVLMGMEDDTLSQSAVIDRLAAKYKEENKNIGEDSVMGFHV